MSKNIDRLFAENKGTVPRTLDQERVANWDSGKRFLVILGDYSCFHLTEVDALGDMEWKADRKIYSCDNVKLIHGADIS